MQHLQNRAVFTVLSHNGAWIVESGGSVLNRCVGKDEAKAAAHKRARASQDAGKPSMVRISGEHGFFPETRESAERIPCTWKSEEMNPLVSSTRAIRAFTTLWLPALMLIGVGVR